MDPLCKVSGHDWDGCRCRCCGETRHELDNNCTCRICGRVLHDWVDTSEKVYVVTSYESGNQYGEDFPVRVCARCGEHFDWEQNLWGY